MLRGLYTAAAGMVTQQRRHDTATQNMVNLNTTGYKQVDSVSHAFPEVLITAMDGALLSLSDGSIPEFLPSSPSPNTCRATSLRAAKV